MSKKLLLLIVTALLAVIGFTLAKQYKKRVSIKNQGAF